MSRATRDPYNLSPRIRKKYRFHMGIKRLSTSLFFSALLVISGCTSPTGYIKSDAWNGPYGFSEKKINDTTYSIMARGNNLTSNERTAKIALLRAANLTLEKGYTYFTIKQIKSSAIRYKDFSPLSIPIPLQPNLFIQFGYTYPTQEPIDYLVIQFDNIKKKYSINANDVLEELSSLIRTSK